MMAFFGRTRFRVTIDIGFGDIVQPIQYQIKLTNYSKGDLFENIVELACYPKEFIFAEKLETILHRGSFNSRMKDFHDLYSMMAASAILSIDSLRSVIRMVFEHRKTDLVLPISFQEDELVRMQNFWNEYLKNLRKENTKILPPLFSDLLREMNYWLESNIKLSADN